MSIDHDQIFKKLIEAFFREFMELFVPAVAKLIDFKRVEFLREEFFTDIRKGDRKRLDLVVKVGLKRGGTKFLLVHVEFESTRKDLDFPKRLFQYYCQLFLRFETEILPVAVFTDNVKWRKPVLRRYQIRIRERTIVDFQYELVKLKNMDYRKYLTSQNPLAYALMAKMNYNQGERVRLKADFLRLILRSRVDPARESLLVDFIETYMPLRGHEMVVFQEVVVADAKFKEVAKMITSYEQKGIKKGRAEGKAMGRASGKQEALILLLENRFGKLDASMRRKVRAIKSSKKLDSLLVSVLEAESLDEMNL